MGSVATRRQQLLDLVRETGWARLPDLAESLGVSVVTIRRDVESLAAAGRLVRRHGSVAIAPAPVALAEDRSRFIGMVVGNATSYVGVIVRAAQDEAQRRGLRFVLEVSDDADLAAAVARMRRDRACAGVLMAPQWHDRGSDAPERATAIAGVNAPAMAGASATASTGPPVVMVEREAPSGHPYAALDRVCTDHAHGVYLGIDHLAGLGHRRIGLVAREDSPTARTVRRAFRTHMAARGTPEPPVWLSPAARPVEGQAARRLADEVLRSEVTAVLAHNDWAALQLAQELRRRGVATPDRLSVVAYDDVVADLAETALTSIAPPASTVGAVAVRLAVRRSAEAGGEAGVVEHIRLMPRLAVRGSTAPPR